MLKQVLAFLKKIIVIKFPKKNSPNGAAMPPSLCHAFLCRAPLHKGYPDYVRPNVKQGFQKKMIP
jgi:hypothetical protein